MFFESLQKQTESKQLYKQAEQVLLQELDLVGYTPKHALSFQVNKREVDRAGRFDAEYFQPKYKEIIEKIEKYKGGFDVVKNVLQFNTKNFFLKTTIYIITYLYPEFQVVEKLKLQKKSWAEICQHEQGDKLKQGMLFYLP